MKLTQLRNLLGLIDMTTHSLSFLIAKLIFLRHSRNKTGFFLKWNFGRFVCLYREGRPRLYLEYPVCGAHELADKGAFTFVVVLTANFPSGFRRDLDLNPQPSLQGKLVECNEIYH